MANITLGKVAPTPKGEWDGSLTYEKLDIVTNSTTHKVYMAIQNVPANTAITNNEYWEILGIQSSDAEIDDTAGDGDTNKVWSADKSYSEVNNIEGMIASEFSTFTAYAVGDLVIYNDHYYRFKTAHPAGAWNASHVDQTTVSGEIINNVTDLKNSINKSGKSISTVNDYLGYRYDIEWITGSCISKATGEPITRQDGAYCETFYPVVRGDTFSTNMVGVGGQNGIPVIAFYDANFVFLGGVSGGDSGKNYVLTVPDNSNITYCRFSTIKYGDSSYFKYDPMFIERYANDNGINNGKESQRYVDQLLKSDVFYYNLSWEAGTALNKNTGLKLTLTHGAFTPDYQYVSPGDILNTNIKGIGIGAIVFYDKYYRYVTAIEKSTYIGEDVNVPNIDTIAYARFSAEHYNDSAYYSDDIYVKHMNTLPNQVEVDIRKTIGNLSDLVTTSKSNIVSAINEVAAGGGESNQSALNQIAYRELVGNENKVFVQHDFELLANNYTANHASITNTDNALNITCVADGSASHQAYINLTSNPIDLSRACIAADIDITEGASGTDNNYTEINEIMLVLSSSVSGFTDSVVARYSLITNANYILYPGKYRLSTVLDIQRIGSAVNIDLSAVTMVGVRITTKPHTSDDITTYPGTPTISINRLFAHGINRRKQIVIGFDGNYKAQLSCASYLKSLGLTGTFFIANSLLAENDTERMSLSDLYELQDAGHLVANYCSGLGYWYTLSLSQKKTAIATNAEWLYAHGFGEGAKCISVPAGGYAADEQIIYTDGYADIITGRIIPASQPKPSSFYDSNPYGHTSGPSGTNADRFTAIESLIKYGGVCVFIFHRCAGYSDDITFDEFKAFADYVADKRNAGLLEVVGADKLKTDYQLSLPV